MTVGDLKIDVERREVTRDKESIDLTATEFDLLFAMASQAGRVFTRAQLLDHLHGVSFESYERAIDSHIKNLRRKLGQHYIETVYGVGYKFSDET